MHKHSHHLYWFSPMLGIFGINSCQLDPEYIPWLLDLEQSLQHEQQPLRNHPVKENKAPL